METEVIWTDSLTNVGAIFLTFAMIIIPGPQTAATTMVKSTGKCLPQKISTLYMAKLCYRFLKRLIQFFIFFSLKKSDPRESRAA